MYAMITFDPFTYPAGAVRIDTFSEPTEDILMKIVPTFAGLILAGTFAVNANADASKGEIMALCKAEIQDSIEDVTRIRTSKFKDRSTGTFITYRVSRDNADTEKVTCTFRDGVASLTDSTGALIASKNSVASTDS